MRSATLLLAFQACESDFRTPAKTRKYVSRPTYGSAEVLKTSATSGFEASAAISVLSTFSARSAGEGKSAAAESSKRRVPVILVDEAASTGMIVPERMP